MISFNKFSRCRASDTFENTVKSNHIIKPALISDSGNTVEFFFHNAETDRMERFRPTKNLNRLKDPKEKLAQFTRLCEAYKIADGLLINFGGASLDYRRVYNRKMRTPFKEEKN